MAKNDNLLYISLIVIFSGFLIFSFSILNKSWQILIIVLNYYVLFLFSGLLISFIGLIMMLIWHFNTRKPYYEDLHKKENNFAPYLAFGILLSLTGFVVIHYSTNLTKFQYLTSTGLSILGTIMLIKGLLLFSQEYKRAIKKKTL